MTTFFRDLNEKFIFFINKNADGFDVADFRIGTIIGTSILIFVPILNLFGNNMVPDVWWARTLLIFVQIFVLAMSYSSLYIKQNANIIGNIFSLIYSFLVMIACFIAKFPAEQSFIALLINFALMGMFKEKKYMYYFFILTTSSFAMFVLLCETPSVGKAFLLFFCGVFWSISYYTNSVKLTNIEKIDLKTNELKKQELWFRRIFDNAPVGIALLDGQYRAFKFNRYLQELTGYTEGELGVLGLDSLIFKDDLLPLNDYIIYVNNLEIKPLEQRIVTKTGRIVWMRSTTSQMVLENVAYTIAMYSDITFEKNSELQMRQFNDQLQLQNAALEEFSYVISHDLQEPLRMITSFSQIIQVRYLKKFDDQEAMSDFRFVIDGAKRMSALIRDMLEYSRWSARQLPIESVDIREVLAETFQNLTVSLNQSHAEVISGDMPIVMANKMMLGQVFQNLIGNAIRYAHPERNPLVEINIEIQPKRIVFGVKDNGIGIREDDQERVFGIFQRLGTKKSEGTGIGLAICKRIIEKQGGTIWVESEVGVGSTFYFTLPNNELSAKGISIAPKERTAADVF